MSAVAHEIAVARGPIDPALSDADVKTLLLRAARARSITDLHPVIKVLVLNRLALSQVIESLTKEVHGSPSSASQFDLALLDQLKAIRGDLEAVQRERDEARSSASATAEQLATSERERDLAQRLVEQAQRELLVVNIQHERLSRESASQAATINEQTAALQAQRGELDSLGERLGRTDAALAEATAQASAAVNERDALRADLLASTATNAELCRRLQSQDRLVTDLRTAVRAHPFARRDDKRKIESLSALLVQRQQETSSALAAGQAATSPNVVAFSNRAEIERLREELRSRDSTIATKDQAVARLTEAHGLAKTRLADLESRLQQADLTNRAQSAGNEALAKTLLAMLPEEQRSIYLSPSYDAAALLLIAEVARRQVQHLNGEQRQLDDEVGRAI